MSTELNAGTVAAYLKIYDQDWSEGLRKANASLANSETAFNRRFGAIQKAADETGNRLLLAGTAGAAALGGMVKLAMDAVESENLFSVSLGKNAGAVRAWSEGLRKELGLNAYEVRKNVGMLYTMTQSMGLSESAAMNMSEGLTKLAYDMASFYNLKPEEAFEKLRSGISGEIEPLRQLGISVDENTAKAYLLKNGIKAKWTEMDQASKVAVRYQIILAQTAKAQGDLARTIESPTNQLRVMQEQAKNLATDIGMQLLPAFQKLLDIGRNLTGVLSSLTEEQKKSYAQWVLWGTVAIIVSGAASKMVGAIGTVIKVLGMVRLASLTALGPLGMVIASGATLYGVQKDMKQAVKAGEDRSKDWEHRRNLLATAAEVQLFPDLTHDEIDRRYHLMSMTPEQIERFNQGYAKANKLKYVSPFPTPVDESAAALAKAKADAAKAQADINALISGAGGGGGTSGGKSAAVATPPTPSLLERTHIALQDAGEQAALLGWDAETLARALLNIYQGALEELAKEPSIKDPSRHPAFKELKSGFETWAKEVGDYEALKATGGEEKGLLLIGKARKTIADAIGKMAVSQTGELRQQVGLTKELRTIEEQRARAAAVFTGTRLPGLAGMAGQVSQGMGLAEGRRQVSAADIAGRAVDGPPTSLLSSWMLPITMAAAVPAGYMQQMLATMRRSEWATAIWDFARDKGSFQEYMASAAEAMGKKGLFSLLGTSALAVNPTTGFPQIAHQLFPSLNNMNAEQAAALKTKLQGGLGAAASLYSLGNIDTTSPLSGGLQGAMGGVGLMQGLSQLGLSAAGGPVGAVIGLVGGAIFGMNESRKAAEERAQQMREQQLEYLKRINNTLQLASDYFRRGMFGALPGVMSYSGMNTEMAWAVQSRRGMQ